MAVVLAEHRLERCLPAADRVVAMDEGRIGFDGTPGTSRLGDREQARAGHAFCP